MSVTRDELKAHCRITHTAEDTQLDIYLNAAIGTIEKRTNRGLSSAERTSKFDCFSERMRLLGPGATSVSIQYLDADGALQTLAATEYEVVTHGIVPYVRFFDAGSLPQLYDSDAAVTITYTSGYGSSELPFQLKAAVLLLGSHYYFHREPVVVGASVSELPFSVESLISQFEVNPL